MPGARPRRRRARAAARTRSRRSCRRECAASRCRRAPAEPFALARETRQRGILEPRAGGIAKLSRQQPGNEAIAGAGDRHARSGLPEDPARAGDGDEPFEPFRLHRATPAAFGGEPVVARAARRGCIRGPSTWTISFDRSSRWRFRYNIAGHSGTCPAGAVKDVMHDAQPMQIAIGQGEQHLKPVRAAAERGFSACVSNAMYIRRIYILVGFDGISCSEGFVLGLRATGNRLPATGYRLPEHRWSETFWPDLAARFVATAPASSGCGSRWAPICCCEAGRQR